MSCGGADAGLGDGVGAEWMSWDRPPSAGNPLPLRALLTAFISASDEAAFRTRLAAPDSPSSTPASALASVPPPEAVDCVILVCLHIKDVL